MRIIWSEVNSKGANKVHRSEEKNNGVNTQNILNFLIVVTFSSVIQCK